MNPDRAASIFRELLQTPEADLQNFARRVGLQGEPTTSDLTQAKEVLQTLLVALQSGPGPNWARVNTMWATFRAKHGALPQTAMDPSKPQWVRDVPDKPTLGDPAPGTSSHAQQEQRRQRFVPTGKPAFHQGGAIATPPPQAPAPAGYQVGSHQPPPPPGREAWPAPPGMYGGAQAAPQPAAPPAAHPQHAAHPQGAGQPRVFNQPPQQPPPPPKREPQTPAQAKGDISESVAKYAAFCAACAAAPDRVFATMVEYGISSPEMRDELDETWNERFDEDGALHKQWEQLFHSFRNQLKNR